MASEAVEIVAGGRSVRVSSPSRVIFPATERTTEITKLEVAQFYLDVEDGLMRALRNRPTTLERWPKGVLAGMKLSTAGSTGDAFYQKRVPRGAPPFLETARITFPSGREANEVCPTEIASVAWAAHMGTITFHPWPVRRDRPDHPDELRIDLDPQPGTDFHDAVRVASELRTLLDEIGITGYPKTSGNRGVHVFIRIEPRWTFVDVRHAAIALGRELQRRSNGVTMNWWKEERGANIFVDVNQNCRDRTMASAYSLRSIAGAPVSTPVTWEELNDVKDPRDFNLHTVPSRLAEIGDPHATIDDVEHSLDTLLAWWERDLRNGLGEMPFPPDYPKMPGEPKRVQPSKAKS